MIKSEALGVINALKLVDSSFARQVERMFFGHSRSRMWPYLEPADRVDGGSRQILETIVSKLTAEGYTDHASTINTAYGLE